MKIDIVGHCLAAIDCVKNTHVISQKTYVLEVVHVFPP